MGAFLRSLFLFLVSQEKNVPFLLENVLIDVPCSSSLHAFFWKVRKVHINLIFICAFGCDSDKSAIMPRDNTVSVKIINYLRDTFSVTMETIT